ncbi:MAG: carbamate kinase [Methanomassiliicoccales archaeon]
MKTALVAIGGNALIKVGEEATYENQMRNLRNTCAHLAKMIASGYDIVLTHGNGPQVGNILIQNEVAKSKVPPMPLDVCVAESQGQLGYMIQQALTEALIRQGVRKVVTCLLTRVVVDIDDPAFEMPTKPVGPYYDEGEKEELRRTQGWDFAYDKNRGGYRRVVPSPKPLRIVECSSIRRLVFGGDEQAEVVVASGGGGIPVVEREGCYEGVEAVVDKDLAAAVMAVGIGEKLLIMLTDIDCAYLNFGKEDQRPLGLVEARRMRDYLEEGHFAPGSMGPKVEAGLYFLEKGGERAIITSADNIEAALEGLVGTQIIR